MASASHINKKRQFQPPITTHFSPASTCGYYIASVQPTNTDISPSGILSPSIPQSVQGTLLNMGMRIRKSIHDGYQTKAKTIEAPVTSSSLTSIHQSKELTPYYVVDNDNNSHQTSMAAIDRNDIVMHDNSDDNDDHHLQCRQFTPDNPFLHAGHVHHIKKRTYSHLDTDLPLSAMPTPPCKSMSPPLRPIAQPKTRRRSGAKNIFGKEYKVEDFDDFEEASFLLDKELLAWYGLDCVH